MTTTATPLRPTPWVRPGNAADATVQALDDPVEQAAFTQWCTTAQGAREAVSQFQLSGMHCAACAGIIEGALSAVRGVLEAHVSVSGARAEVRWDPQLTRPSALVAAVRAAGYGAVPDAAAPARALRQAEQRRALWRIFVAGLCMMQVMMYAAPAYVAAPGEISPDVQRLLQWASWLLCIPVMLFSAAPFFGGAWRSLRQGRMAMDVPVALGLAVTFVASSGATFDPGGVFGREVYFDSLAMFVFFLLGGRYLELRARHAVAATLEGTLARLPQTVLRLDATGVAETVALRLVRPGERLRILAGQAFPADGTLLEGRTLADEALLTGESRPVAKGVGDEVVAGSLNLHAPVVLRVVRIGPDTRYEGIVALTRSALTHRPALVRQADRLAGPFLWGVLVLALAAAALWSIIDPPRAVWVAVSVLIVTCPCALSLAAPSALLAATGALARRGILLQRLEALEALARVDWLYLDKTGTLTEDRMHLVAIDPQPAALSQEQGSKDLLHQAATLAALSTHPIARALVAAAEPHPPLPNPWSDVQETPGLGLAARHTDGSTYRLGNANWVAADGHAEGGDSNVWFGREGQVLARFEVAEVMRADAATAIRRLSDAGLHVAILSGDSPARTEALGQKLGLHDVRGGASPEDKLSTLAEAQAAGHVVAMVGDGLNDAPVLARADVSFAFAHGSAIAKLHADAILLGDRLGDVADARDHARRTMRVLRQNLTWAALYNAVCIPLALAGWLPPWAAGLGMACSSLFVVLNSLRLRRLPQ